MKKDFVLKWKKNGKKYKSIIKIDPKKLMAYDPFRDQFNWHTDASSFISDDSNCNQSCSDPCADSCSDPCSNPCPDPCSNPCSDPCAGSQTPFSYPVSFSILPGGSVTNQNFLSFGNFPNPIDGMNIDVPFQPSTEGTATLTNQGIFNFYSAPRFSTSAIGSYRVTDIEGSMVSSIIKISCNQSFATSSGILIANSTNQVYLYNVATGTNTTITFPAVVNEIASDLSDMLLFITISTSLTSIQVYDWVLGNQLIGAINISTILSGIPTLVGSYITALSYDSNRNILYVGLSQGNYILALSLYPYTRYPTPSIPSYTYYLITLPTTSVLTNNAFVTDIAVEPNSGNLYFTAKNVAAVNVYLYLITNQGILLGSTDGSFYLPAEIVEQVGITNNNLLLVNQGTSVHQLTGTSLLSSPSVGPVLFVSVGGLSDFSNPLYGM